MKRRKWPAEMKIRQSREQGQCRKRSPNGPCTWLHKTDWKVLVELLFPEMLRRNLVKATYRHQWANRLWQKAWLCPQRKKNSILRDVSWIQNCFASLRKQTNHQTVEAEEWDQSPHTGKMWSGKHYLKGKVLFTLLLLSFSCVYKYTWFTSVCVVSVCVRALVCGCMCLWRPEVAVSNHPGSLIKPRTFGSICSRQSAALEYGLESWAGQEGWQALRWVLGIWTPVQHLNQGAICCMSSCWS